MQAYETVPRGITILAWSLMVTSPPHSGVHSSSKRRFTKSFLWESMSCRKSRLVWESEMRDVEVRKGKIRTCMSIVNEIIACSRRSIKVETRRLEKSYVHRV